MKSHLVQSLWIGAAAGLLSGSASAVFLISLEAALQLRQAHPPLIWGLPLAGALVGWVYAGWGRAAAPGANLLLDALHDADEGKARLVPLRMAPLVLAGTVVTHLFGGSAGREGTAVQMGGSLAAALSLRPDARRGLLLAGIAGGFSSVFGTPLAGTVFALEVTHHGRQRYDWLLACGLAAVVGDLLCRGLGVGHHAYPSLPAAPPLALLWVALSTPLWAGAARLFVWLTHRIKAVLPGGAVGQPLLGGSLVLMATLLVGHQRFNGLGIPLIDQAFEPAGSAPSTWAAKLLWTAVTLGAGFKGGEVTPLFCIGATLGSAWAHLLGQSTALFAGVGFVAVFAGAANTPLACTLMGLELFGSGAAVPLLIGCCLTYLLSGEHGIYSSQRVGEAKPF